MPLACFPTTPFGHPLQVSAMPPAKRAKMLPSAVEARPAVLPPTIQSCPPSQATDKAGYPKHVGGTTADFDSDSATESDNGDEAQRPPPTIGGGGPAVLSTATDFSMPSIPLTSPQTPPLEPSDTQADTDTITIVADAASAEEPAVVLPGQPTAGPAEAQSGAAAVMNVEPELVDRSKATAVALVKTVVSKLLTPVASNNLAADPAVHVPDPSQCPTTASKTELCVDRGVCSNEEKAVNKQRLQAPSLKSAMEIGRRSETTVTPQGSTAASAPYSTQVQPQTSTSESVSAQHTTQAHAEILTSRPISVVGMASEVLPSVTQNDTSLTHLQLSGITPSSTTDYMTKAQAATPAQTHPTPTQSKEQASPQVQPTVKALAPGLDVSEPTRRPQTAIDSRTSTLDPPPRPNTPQNDDADTPSQAKMSETEQTPPTSSGSHLESGNVPDAVLEIESTDSQVDVQPTTTDALSKEDHREFVCNRCGEKCLGELAMVMHDYLVHQRIKYRWGDAKEGKNELFACRICGKGSGVVYGTITELCDHLICHATGAELVLPPGAVGTTPSEPNESGDSLPDTATKPELGTEISSTSRVSKHESEVLNIDVSTVDAVEVEVEVADKLMEPTESIEIDNAYQPLQQPAPIQSLPSQSDFGAKPINRDSSLPQPGQVKDDSVVVADPAEIVADPAEIVGAAVLQKGKVMKSDSAQELRKSDDQVRVTVVDPIGYNSNRRESKVSSTQAKNVPVWPLANSAGAAAAGAPAVAPLASAYCSVTQGFASLLPTDLLQRTVAATAQSSQAPFQAGQQPLLDEAQRLSISRYYQNSVMNRVIQNGMLQNQVQQYRCQQLSSTDETKLGITSPASKTEKNSSANFKASKSKAKSSKGKSKKRNTSIQKFPEAPESVATAALPLYPTNGVISPDDYRRWFLEFNLKNQSKKVHELKQQRQLPQQMLVGSQPEGLMMPSVSMPAVSFADGQARGFHIAMGGIPPELQALSTNQLPANFIVPSNSQIMTQMPQMPPMMIVDQHGTPLQASKTVNTDFSRPMHPPLEPCSMYSPSSAPTLSNSRTHSATQVMPKAWNELVPGLSSHEITIPTLSSSTVEATAVSVAAIAPSHPDQVPTESPTMQQQHCDVVSPVLPSTRQEEPGVVVVQPQPEEGI